MWFSHKNRLWEQERLQLLTQISDLQALISKMQEDAARERSEIWDRFLSILRPSRPSSNPPMSSTGSFSRFPGSRNVPPPANPTDEAADFTAKQVS